MRAIPPQNAGSKILTMKVNAPIAAILFLTAVLASSCGFERVNNYYPDYVAANKTSNDYLPKFMPKNATLIYEQHDFDTNESWVAFRFIEQDIASIEAACTSTGAPPSRLPINIIGLKRRWWYRYPLDSTATRQLIRGCSGGGSIYIDQPNSVAYFWRR